jgi:signal transduction histidine kinase/CheY-like chemotaxis protein
MSNRIQYLVITSLTSIIVAISLLMAFFYSESHNQKSFMVNAQESYSWQTSQLLISYQKLRISVLQELQQHNSPPLSVRVHLAIFSSRVDALQADSQFSADLARSDGFLAAFRTINHTRNQLQSLVDRQTPADKATLQTISLALLSIKDPVTLVSLIGRRLEVQHAEFIKTRDRHNEHQLGVMQIALFCCFSFLVMFLWQQKYLARERTRRLACAEEAKCLAESASKAKSQFLTTVSHELRTPLQAVLGAVSLLEGTATAENNPTIISIIKQSSYQLNSLVEDLIDLSRLENQQLKLHLAQFSFQQWSSALTALLQPQANQKQLKFDCFGKNMPDTLIFDRTRLDQIVANLVMNAVKFTDTGFVRIEYAFIPALLAHHGVLQIKVSDSGSGIADADSKAIFEPFTQLHHFSTSKEGMGLGLAIVAQLVKLAHGGITLTSTPGLGSVFSVRLPVEVPAEDPIWSPPLCGAPSLNTPERSATRILLVDDDASLRMVMALFIKEMGYEYDVAENGLDALQQLASYRYAAIVTDIQMPLLNGFDLARQLRARPQAQIPIIAITAFAQSLVDENDARLFDLVLYKPIERSDLQRALLRLIVS